MQNTRHFGYLEKNTPSRSSELVRKLNDTN
nr:MAG TPA: hypothetical protein [Caudoviricetes sp.]